MCGCEAHHDSTALCSCDCPAHDQKAKTAEACSRFNARLIAEFAPAAVADNTGEHDPAVMCPGCKVAVPGGTCCAIRPAASPGVQADDCPWRVGEHYGLHVYEGERPVATFHDPADAERAVQAVNARADDCGGTMATCGNDEHLGHRHDGSPYLAQADDGRTEELRAPLNDDWWTALYLAASDAVDRVPYAAASEYPVPHAAAFRAAVEPFIAPLLAATTGRGDDGAVQRVLALAADYDANGNSRELSDPAAAIWHKAANGIRAAVAGCQDAETC